MTSEGPTSQPRKMLASSFPHSRRQTLAGLLHDCQNKLTPVEGILSLLKYKGEIHPEDYREAVQIAEQVRMELSQLLEAAMNGDCSRDIPSEMRNMFVRLMGIKFYMQGLASEEEEEEEDPIADIQSSVHEFGQLAAKARALKLGQVCPEKRELGNISAYVLDIVRSYQQRYPHIRFNMTIDEDCVIPFRMGRVKNALENILKNSIESLPENGGQITINLKTRLIKQREEFAFDLEGGCIKEGDYISIEIEDNGPGIPDEVLDAFLTKPISTKPGGSGLGITNAAYCFEEHGGYMLLESDPGNGTKITGLLPSSFPPPPLVPHFGGSEGTGNHQGMY